METPIYKGQYVEAESVGKYIDIESITEGCNYLKEITNTLQVVSGKIIATKDYCTKENFSINEVTVEDEIEFCGNGIKETSLYLQDLVDMIMTALKKAIENKQLLLNEKAEEEEKQILKRDPEERKNRL